MADAALQRGSFSAGGTWHHDRPGRHGLVLRPGQVPVEYPADRVAGQILQDRDRRRADEPGRPWLPGRQPPGSLFGPTCGVPSTGRPPGPATWRQRASRPWSRGRPNADVQRLTGRPAGRSAPSGRARRGDAPGRRPVPPLRPGPQREPPGIRKPAADHQPERRTGPQRVAGLAVPGQAPLDAGGIQQDREAAALAVPQLVLGRAAGPRAARAAASSTSGHAGRHSPRSSARRTTRRAGAGCAAPRSPSGG